MELPLGSMAVYANACHTKTQLITNDWTMKQPSPTQYTLLSVPPHPLHSFPFPPLQFSIFSFYFLFFVVMVLLCFEDEMSLSSLCIWTNCYYFWGGCETLKRWDPAISSMSNMTRFIGFSLGLAPSPGSLGFEYFRNSTICKRPYQSQSHSQHLDLFQEAGNQNSP